MLLLLLCAAAGLLLWKLVDESRLAIYAVLVMIAERPGTRLGEPGGAGRAITPLSWLAACRTPCPHACVAGANGERQDLSAWRLLGQGATGGGLTAACHCLPLPAPTLAPPFHPCCSENRQLRREAVALRESEGRAETRCREALTRLQVRRRAPRVYFSAAAAASPSTVAPVLPAGPGSH